jgi:3-oxoadipate enol-lactonase
MPYADTGAITLHYRVLGTPTQDAPPVLLLPELGGSSESWSAALPLFAQFRQTIAIDPRGTGLSEKPPGSFSIEDCADDLNAFLSRIDIASVDVVGGALGSLIGAVLAARHPARVRRLLLCAVSDELGGVTAEYVAARAKRVVIEGMRAVAEASLRNSFPDAFASQRETYRPLYLANHPQSYAAMSLALSRLTPDWAAIRQPTLVVSGQHDFIWPPAHGQRVAGLIPGARFHVLTEAGHFPHLQTPAALAALAREFFA